MKIGQRVKVINTKNLENKYIKHGDTGTVIDYKYDDIVGTILGVEMDKYIKGHDCENRGEQGFCIWIRKTKLQAITTEKINISKIADKIIEFVCKNSQEGSYILDYIDISEIISERDFKRHIKDIVRELNKRDKVASVDLIGDEIDITVWSNYLK